MKLRIASIAFLLGSACVGLAWLPLQPSLVRLMAIVRHLAAPGAQDAATLSRVQGLLPFYLGFALLGSILVCYVILLVMVEQPLRRFEDFIGQIGRLEMEATLGDGGGPLLSRSQAALSRRVEALRQEQATTQRQLTELRAAHERLTRTQAELVSAERLATVGKLAAGVAHEVGNPLSGILGYLSLARSRMKDDAQAVDFLDRIDAEVQRIDNIVRGLLDLGRPPRGELRPVDVAPLADTCVRLVSKGPDFSGVAVDVQVAPLSVARADPGQLSQVLLNLLINAAQAMGGKGHIRLTCRRDGPRIVVEVLDSGAGIPPEALPRLFEPFFTTKSGGKGTGLGLAVSQRLIQAMGGEISAANVEGGGARFTVVLPSA